jgi:hypothetical protein
MLAGYAVDHKEVTVARGLHRDLARAALGSRCRPRIGVAAESQSCVSFGEV